MRSRTIREGSVGLLILLGLGLFAGLILWLRGVSLGNRSYKVILEFANVSGMEPGTPVRYRGVAVGKIVRTQPGPKGVDVEAEISPPDLIIPKDVIVEANQSGLLGATSIDINPVRSVAITAATKPLDRDCNRDVIVCNNSHLQGQIGVSVDELIRASIRFTSVYSDPKIIDNVNTLARNSSEAAAEITRLSREFRSLARVTREQVGTFSASARAIGQAANQFGLTAVQLNSLVAANRTTLVGTLDNISAITTQLRTTVASLNPVLNRVGQGDLLRNLELLSNNAAQASANLRDVSQALNNPSNLATLQQTLDSARATFENAQKITSDLDDLTGDPQFRNNLKNLVNGLSGLVSSTQQLQQQAQLAQVLTSIQAANRTNAPTAASEANAAEAATLPPSSQPVPQSSAPPSLPARPANE